MLAHDSEQQDQDAGVRFVFKQRLRTHSLIGAGLLALLVLGLGAKAPLSRDDFLSLERISDVERGHWLIIHDSYPEFHQHMVHDATGSVSRKPPLFFWACALGVKLAGRISEIDVRLVSIVAAAGVALEVLVWTATYAGAGNAWLGFLFLLGSYGFAARATVVLPDMLLTFFIFSAFCLTYALIEEEVCERAAPPAGSERAVGYRSHWRAIVVGVLLGLAVLTKGPVGVLLYALAASIYLLWLRCRPWAPLRRMWPWEALLTAVLVAGWWYVAMWLELGSGALRVIQVENLGAFLPAKFGGEGSGSRGFLYIELKILAETLPLSLLVPAFCLSPVFRVHDQHERRPFLFQLSFLLAVALFFSVASMKRDDYILPALPSLAILLASVFTIEPGPDAAGRDRGEQKPSGYQRSISWFLLARALAAVLAGAGTLLLIAGVLVLAHGPVSFGSTEVRLQATDFWYADLFAAGISRLSLPFVSFAVALAAAEVVLFTSVFKKHAPGIGAGLALLSITAVSLWTGVLRPELNRRRSLKQFAEKVTREVGTAPVYYFGYPPREISFYEGHYIAKLRRKRGWCTATNEPVYLILWQREAAGLPRKCIERLRPVLIADEASADRPGLFKLMANENPH